MIRVLFASRAARWEQYERPLRNAFAEAGLEVVLAPDLPPAEVDYIVYGPSGPDFDFAPYTRLKAVLSLWAGVETVVDNPTLTVPLTRMVDTGLTEGMVEWVTGHVLRHHLGMDIYLHGQDGVWRREIPPLARDRTVGILGLGALGAACGKALAGLNFRVAGWSRRPKEIAGIDCHDGTAGLTRVLEMSEIVVLLLPLTPETVNTLDAAAFARLPRGAMVLNPGRGALIDDSALIDALDSGQIGHATLDVFRQEPLPADHPYWSHPHVTVTPHIASETRPETAARVIAGNIRRAEAGELLLHLVDRSAGY